MGGGAGGEAIELALTGQHDTIHFFKLLRQFDNCGLAAQTGSGRYTNVSSHVACYVSHGAL
jgi:hypothetical protein